MSWPLSHEFNESIQNPQICFNDPDLKTSNAVVGAQGLPLPRSGNFADVYQVKGSDGRDWAVKCFTRHVFGLGERYAQVSDALAKANLPFAVGFTFLAEGIRVNGVWRPIVKMEWVEGLLLNHVVRENAGRPQILTALNQMWVKLCKRLRDAGVAHADLQHGNVLLVPGSRQGAYGLKLIDYDGMYVPTLANKPSGEAGHPSFQHPARASTKNYSPDVDRFPHLVIATALKGLSVAGQPLWDRYDNGDNLLFTEADYRKPSDSKAMRELWQTENPSVQALVGRLAIACGRAIPQTPWLDQFAPDGEPELLSNEQRQEAANALGIALPVPVSVAPKSKFEVVAEAPAPAPVVGEFDIEPVEDSQPARKKRKAKNRAERPKGSKIHLLLIAAGGGVLLLVGGIIAGIVLASGTKKPDDFSEKEKPDDKKPPVPKPKPPDGPSIVTPKPPDNPPPETVIPKQPVRRPVDRFDVKKQWTTDLGPEFRNVQVTCSLDGRAAVAHDNTNKGGTKMLDLSTGKDMPVDLKNVRRISTLRAMQGSRISHVTLGGAEPIQILDTKTGEWTDITCAQFNPIQSYKAVSPDGQYIAVGVGNTLTPVPFKLQRVSDRKTILDFDWVRGYIHFTSDSSRVLLAEEGGRCRWYKLPSGEADGEWELRRLRDSKIPGLLLFTGALDGSVFLYSGELEGFEGVFHLIDGRTGRVLHSFRGDYFAQRASLSADGRLLILHKSRLTAAQVIDTTTGTVLAEFSVPSGAEHVAATLLPDGSGAVVLTDVGKAWSMTRYDFVPAETSVVTQVAKDTPQLKLRWSAPVGDVDYGPLYLSGSTNLALLGAFRGDVLAIDLKSGISRGGFGGAGRVGMPSFFPQDNKRVALTVPNNDEVRVVDETTGNEVSKFVVPNIPPYADNRAFFRLFVSPNARYAVAVRFGHPLKPDEFPMRVIDVVNNKVLVDGKWAGGGNVHFTADSSRVLIAEADGRCRWFKLPSGEADDQWKFPPPSSNRTHEVTSISADGSLLGYRGPLGHSGESNGPAVLNGKTGKVVHLFSYDYHMISPVYLSADGRRAVVLRNQMEEFFGVDIVEARTGAVFGRATVKTGRSFPSITLTSDGSVAAIIANSERKLHVFEVDPSVTPKAPAPDLGQLTIKERHKLELKFTPHGLKFEANGQSVIAFDHQKSAVNIDVQTGAVRELTWPQNVPPPCVVNLPDGRIGIWPLGSRELTLVEAKTGKPVGSLPGPEFPPNNNGAPIFPYKIEVSSNERFVAVGVSPQVTVNQETKEPTFHPAPLRVVDTKTKKNVLETEWKGGWIFFNADSSRLFVLDRFFGGRWFDLSTGKLDKEWTFKHQTGTQSRFNLIGSTSDARVLLCNGPLIPGRSTYFLLDNETGEVNDMFTRPTGYCSGLSTDGRLAIFQDLRQKERTFVLFDVARKVDVGWITVPNADGSFPHVAMAPDGRSLVVADHRLSVVAVYDLARTPQGVAAPDPDTPKGSELKVRWEVPVKLTSTGPAKPYFDSDGQTVFLATSEKPSTITAFDARTGKLIREQANIPNDLQQLLPMEKGKIAFQQSVTETVMWDPETEKPVRTAGQPSPSAGESVVTNISPNGKYMTGCFSRAGANPGATARLMLLDTAGGKSSSLNGWTFPLRTAFTPDSSRVLIWDSTDRFQWHNFATGKSEGEWRFAVPAGKANSFVPGLSADGSVILYYGTPPGKEKQAYHILDGKKGTVLHSFPVGRYQPAGFYSAGSSLSEDGRFVTFLRVDSTTRRSYIDVLDVRGKLLATATLPEGGKLVAASWKAGIVVLHDEQNKKLIAYELPTAPNP